MCSNIRSTNVYNLYMIRVIDSNNDNNNSRKHNNQNN